MNNFIMLVGLPGCGKSTFANKLVKQGYVIHSPDSIRNEFNLHDLSHTEAVYSILNKRFNKDISLGKDIVYDATNLIQKRRIEILKKLSNYNKKCYLFITQIDICKERNSHRIGPSRVPDTGYEIMLRSFDTPMIEEGFDTIVPIYENLTNFISKIDIREEFNKYKDIGKSYTKHNYEHYGAYLYLTEWLSTQNYSFENALTISQLINWQNRIKLWKYNKILERDKKFLSEDFYNLLKGE